ncbi:MAG: phosphate/phosphite/phosphonate ABC transporter substrate-binding protein [Candidatus Methanoperedens sp.]|nr:phosphate/phosphite/phosphonate ABC transporter substrate-binding protein [Candidatus Methanoperedens sp.]
MKTILLIILTSAIISSGCIEKTEMLNLSIVKEPDIRGNDTAIKVAISSVISPKESINYYEGLIQYISSKLGRPIKIIHRRTYQEINDMVKKGEIDFAFVCSGPYVEGNDEFGMKLLVVPESYGKNTYYSYIIVPRNSNYTNLSDLRGKRFAFTDPLSNTGWLYPAYRLSLINETPESFFGADEKFRNNFFYTYSHDNSIIAVAEGVAEGAAVNSRVYEYMKFEKPDIIQQTRIIEVSQPFANPPVVVSGDVDPLFEQRLKDIFLNMDKDEEGKKILSRIMIDRFVTLNDSNYDPIREMRNSIK